ncbi:RDD family protein [Roseateles sp.]|uniref:RDD family protein n=1 Tax=Roseateles sp. TaxID=1971397 RepID=UPI0032656988
MTTTDAGSTSPSLAITPFAGFWRRLAAFVVDTLLLGGVGLLLGWLAFDALAALGGWGRVVGFALAWPYFGLMNSRLAGGQTVGKRLLGLRTVGLNGALLSPARGLVRGAVVAVPWFLNNAVADPALLEWLPLVMLLTLLVFGLGLGLVYLLVFNRPSRRSLHDWAAGSVVVREPLSAGSALGGPTWRGHLAVVGLLALLSLALPVWMQRQLGEGDVAVMMAVRATVIQQPGVRQAGVTKGWSSIRSTQGSSSSTYLTVQAVSDAEHLKDEALCERIAGALLARHAAAVEQVDQLVVVVTYGYDIGIASGWQSRRVALSPAQWRERLRRESPVAI